MAAKPTNVSLTPELKAFIERRVRSGRYGNASDVVRAGLRALDREEMGEAYREWREAAARLPQDPITPEIEARLANRVRVMRRDERRKARK